MSARTRSERNRDYANTSHEVERACTDGPFPLALEPYKARDTRLRMREERSRRLEIANPGSSMSWHIRIQGAVSGIRRSPRSPNFVFAVCTATRAHARYQRCHSVLFGIIHLRFARTHSEHGLPMAWRGVGPALSRPQGNPRSWHRAHYARVRRSLPMKGRQRTFWRAAVGSPGTVVPSA